LARLLVNRWSEIQATHIHKKQLAFIPGRDLTDGSILAIQEVWGSIQSSHSQKAYDKLNWEFIRQVMIKRGYSITWVN